MFAGADKLFGYLARALGGPAALGRFTLIATLTVAETSLKAIKKEDGGLADGLIRDIRHFKDDLYKKNRLDDKVYEAQAHKTVAEAAKASNRNSFQKRTKVIAARERELEAQANLTQAKADATRTNAQTKRIAAIARAKAELIEALSKLKQEGGQVYMDPENLKEILRLGESQQLPPPEENPPAPAQDAPPDVILVLVAKLQSSPGTPAPGSFPRKCPRNSPLLPLRPRPPEPRKFPSKVPPESALGIVPYSPSAPRNPGTPEEPTAPYDRTGHFDCLSFSMNA